MFSYSFVIHIHQAELVPIPDPSLTEQYEYASEHEIKCLVIITDMGVSQTGFVKVIWTLEAVSVFAFPIILLLQGH